MINSQTISRNLVMTGTLLLADLALAIMYAILPTSIAPARSFIDVIQFVSMAATMGCAIAWAIEDF